MSQFGARPILTWQEVQRQVEEAIRPLADEARALADRVEELETAARLAVVEFDRVPSVCEAHCRAFRRLGAVLNG